MVDSAFHIINNIQKSVKSYNLRKIKIVVNLTMLNAYFPIKNNNSQTNEYYFDVSTRNIDDTYNILMVHTFQS